MSKSPVPRVIVFSLFLFAAIAMPASAAEPKQNGGGKSDKQATTPAKGYKDLNVEQFDKLRSNTNTVILDVRTPEEFAAGHIPGAKNIDINSLDFDRKTGHLDKSKTYLVNCASGGRSARACGKLSKMNFENCYNLLGGMHAWEKAGKPVEK
jgi:phage shock protein E